MEEELLDYIAPQIYFTFANPRAPYGEVASWWSNICKGKKVHLYIGQALYKINDDTDQYFKGVNAVPEFTRQLKFNAVKPEIMGSILFRTKNLTDAAKQQVVGVIKNDLWSAKALVPVMPWKGGAAPDTPVQGKVEAFPEGINVSWKGNDPNTAYYAVYRFNKGEVADVNSDKNAAKLIGVVRKAGERQEFFDKGMTNPGSVVYAVTALDRLHNESKPLSVSIYQSKYFLDVGMDYFWAVDAIDKFYECGIIAGSGLNAFSPGQKTKRGDFILMSVRAFNLDSDFKDNFPDVPENSYYYNATGIAKELGIIAGSGGGFKPEASITREDMMVVAAKILEKSGLCITKAEDDYLAGYKDMHLISSYARESIAKMTKAGYIQGAGGELNPKYPTTRAEITVLLNNILEKTPNINQP